MTDSIEAKPIGLNPDDQLSIHGDLFSAQGAALLAMENCEGTNHKKFERQAKIYERLYLEFCPLGLKLTHSDKTLFFYRIDAFFSKFEKNPSIIDETLDQNLLVFELLFDLLGFVLIHATNIAERLPHVTTALQNLYRKIGTAIRILQELHRNTAA